MTVDLQKIVKLSEKLQGYGDTDYEVKELSNDECKILDTICFECTRCNHWFHQRENANLKGSEWFCKDCK